MLIINGHLTRSGQIKVVVIYITSLTLLMSRPISVGNFQDNDFHEIYVTQINRIEQSLNHTKEYIKTSNTKNKQQSTAWPQLHRKYTINRASTASSSIRINHPQFQPKESEFYFNHTKNSYWPQKCRRMQANFTYFRSRKLFSTTIIFSTLYISRNKNVNQNNYSCTYMYSVPPYPYLATDMWIVFTDMHQRQRKSK